MTPTRKLPPLLKQFWLAMAVLTAGSIVYTAVAAYLYKLPSPYGLPLLWSDSLWGDFLVFRSGFLKFGTPQFWSSFEYPLTYPAPLGVAFAFFYRCAHPVRLYMMLCFAALGLGVWTFVRALVRRQIAPLYAWGFTLTLLPMIWPLLFFIDTCNIEGLVVIVMACGLIAVLCERCWLGAALLGVAGAMKIFPFVLLALLLSKRRYKEFAWGILVAAVVMLGSLAFLGPTIAGAQRQINIGLQLVKDRYFFSMLTIAPAFDHSLWIPVRFWAVDIDRLLHPLPIAAQAARTRQVLEASFTTYLLVTALAGVIVFFTKIRKLPMLNQVLALSACAVLLPPLSIDYTLLNLLLPFCLLCLYAIDRASRGERVRGLQLILLCFVPIFNADSFLNHDHIFATEPRLVGLIVLLIALLRNPLPEPTREVKA